MHSFKKGLVFFILVIGLLGVACADNSVLYDNSTLTGFATVQQTALNVQILAQIPSISILSPISGNQYIKNTVFLNFLASNYYRLIYNLDNGQNLTLASPQYINVTNGTHILYVYATNSDGLTSVATKSFKVNSALLKLNYTSYQNGSSTDLNVYSYEALQNITNLTFDVPKYGKIQFNQGINITNNQESNNTIDLDDNIKISDNEIEINTTNLPNLNKSATLEFYNVQFQNPAIMVDGLPCPDTLCQKLSFSGGNFIFNVAHFSSYSLAESSDNSSQSSGTGGSAGSSGGRGESSLIKQNLPLKISPKVLAVNIGQGETDLEQINLTNTGQGSLDININVSDNLKEFIKFSEVSFSLAPGQSKTIDFDFIARENAFPSIYAGDININSQGENEQIPVAVGVQAKNALFDIKLSIPSEFSIVSPGDDVIGTINLYNLGETGRIDTAITYSIEDAQGNTIETEKETIAVETQASLLKTIKLPQDMKEGNYLLTITAEYNGKSAQSFAWFEVKQKASTSSLLIYILTLVIIFILMIILYNILLTRYSLKGNIKPIDGYSLSKSGYLKSKVTVENFIKQVKN